ncbi:MAG: hypothetical protein ABSC23_14765 [Bryobacteraceae bacterium]|jgi:hypothetical protein
MRTHTFWKTLGLTLAFACAAWSQAAGSPVGVFTSSGDVGVTPKAGSTEYNAATGEYRITGGGANIWAAVDAFQFVWKTLSGDLTLTADIQFLGAGAQEHRKAVLMVRQDLTPGSAYADLALHGVGLTSLQYRLAAGAQTLETQSTFNGSTANGPVRVTLQRRGDNYTVSIGKPGGEMTSIGPQTVALKDPVYVGIGVCSHDANVLETAVFSNVKIVQP